MFFFSKHNIVRAVHNGTVLPMFPCVCAFAPRLENTQVDAALIALIVDYLAGRPQLVELV